MKIARINATPAGVLRVLATERRQIEAVGFTYVCDLSGCATAEVNDADIVLIGSQYKVARSFLVDFPRCRHVITCTSGYDHIAVTQLSEQGVLSYNMPLARAVDVAETALLMMLEGLRHNYRWHQIYQQTGQWCRDQLHGMRRLQGKRIAIVGCGRIGERVVARLQGFEPDEIRVYDPYKKVTVPGVKQVGTVKDLLIDIDVLTFHCTLNDENRYFINDSWFRQLTQQPVVIINTARGKLIDQQALLSFLKKNPQSSAMLDVFDAEPLPPTHGFRALDNCFITPHSAGYSEDMIDSLPDLVIDEVIRIRDHVQSPFVL